MTEPPVSTLQAVPPSVGPRVQIVLEGDGNDILAWLNARLDELRPKARGKRGPKRLPPETIRDIRKRVEQGEDKMQVAKTFGITPQSVGDIACGKTHKQVE